MSACMYNLRPIVNHDDPLPVPSHNMYRMKPVQGDEGPGQGISCASTGSTVRLADLPSRVQELIQGTKGDMIVLEGRQEDILKKLAKLRIDIEELRTILRQPSKVTAASMSSSSIDSCPHCPELGETMDIVLNASPEHPPYSILGLARVLGALCPLQLSNHTHSSVKAAPAVAQTFCNNVTGTPRFRVTLVWKDVGAETELVINPVKYTAIRGETNILRFFSRVGTSNFAYETDSDLIRVAQIDELLDICQQLARSRLSKEKQAIIRNFNTSLGKSEWMCGRPKLSIADIAVWSMLKQLGSAATLPQNLSKWMERCDSILL